MHHKYVLILSFIITNSIQETVQQSLDGLDAVEKLWEEDDQEAEKMYHAKKQQLFDAMSMNIKRIVRESLAPLSTLRNPLT
jgi:hypothetical protein